MASGERVEIKVSALGNLRGLEELIGGVVDNSSFDDLML